ncbi:Protein of unknown function [Gryllus bimaculatus]|nr:Protein of unknown function [Gryllus bimaculatus]
MSANTLIRNNITMLAAAPPPQPDRLAPQRSDAVLLLAGECAAGALNASLARLAAAAHWNPRDRFLFAFSARGPCRLDALFELAWKEWKVVEVKVVAERGHYE